MITIEELKKYIGVNIDDNTLLEIYIDTSKQIVESYLGYNPEHKSYTHYISGLGEKFIKGNTKLITTINEIIINNESIDINKVFAENEYIYLKDGFFPQGNNNIFIDYEGGYNPMLGVIKLTCLRLSSLMYMESDGNIGITSKSFGDSGTRTFIQTTNYDKYLQVLNRYRIKRI